MQQRSEETRSHILTAAKDLIAHSGYEAAGVAEICQAAGVSKGAFYHHFPSKHAVFQALLDDWLATLDQQLVALQRTNQPVPQTMLEMAAMMRVIFRAAEQNLPIFLEFWTQASRDPQVWQATIAPYRRYQEFFARLVQSGIAEGSLRRVDPQVAARLIVAMAIGMLLQGLLDPEGADWVQVVQQSMQMLLDGLAEKIQG